MATIQIGREFVQILIKSIILLLLLITSNGGAIEQKPPVASTTANSNSTHSTNAIQLTQAEKEWLNKHHHIRVGIAPVYPPLKFSEGGKIKGIEPDFLKLLSEYTGIQFEYVIADFIELDAKVKSRELDMFISFYIPSRLEYMTFTEPVMEFKQVVIARNDFPFVSGINGLRGKRVAIVRGVKLQEKLLSQHPDIQAVPVNTMEEMFQAVSKSDADALFSKTYFAGYMLKQYPELKIAGILDLPPEPYLYAVRKDYPELVSILNKAIKSIPQETHEAIIQKWFNVKIEYKPNWSHILKWVLAVGTFFLVILGLSLIWNRRLAKEIEKRVLLEKKQNELIDDLHKAIAEVKTLKGIIPICSSCKKIRDDKGYWNQVEEYVRDHTEAEFSHGICPDCIVKHYPEFISKEQTT